ncbi:MAG TPA: NAD(P)H-dependent oxidoreductase [Chitinophagaceae bacterium]|nr:NAD(P)H-dependent oxidoreductase [Chitinophagaceae bacterium]HNF71696.1 NAD(P)H-dependent oxidoreductase [Chitinophagaceae bacterium]
MITIISTTNRVGSNTLKVSKEYQRIFSEEGMETSLLSLEDFHSFHRDDDFIALEEKYLIPATKFVFIMPEYNGSFPGIFKLLMDLSNIRLCWNFKKVMLVGVADGRAGNLRGIDNMTNMCHYMKMNVYHDKLPISSLKKEMENGVFIQDHTLAAIRNQIRGFISF